ncbi:MAG: citrate synthase [Planctomycetota bacterium]|jgi:citrate synthase|nr:citrate synthase [Planctomycetota bacterium]
MSDVASFQLGDQQLEMPVVTGSEGERGVDISRLRAETGVITLDPGYANTGSCQSDITFIDGEKGILRYRGYPIEELAQKSTFLEVAYLLLYGELPTQDVFDEFKDEICHHTMIHESIKWVYRGLPKAAHPMAVCAAVVGALATYYPEDLEPGDSGQVRMSVHRLLAKFPTIAAYSYKYSIGQPFMYPVNRLDYASNFLHMMFATPCEEYEIPQEVSQALDLLLILHADHEQNCSTSTVRMVGSSLSNLFASISAGIGALWGSLHGGANQAVIEMLEQIALEDGSAEAFVSKTKDKKSGIRLMGFGHRVYRNYDPRAKILKSACSSVLDALGVQERLLEIAMNLEEIALKDEYFVSRKLYPNVDFYSGLIYRAIGIPVNMFTVLFALGRLPGWMAHWKEMHQDPAFKIGRPRQIYVGPEERSYVPMENR